LGKLGQVYFAPIGVKLSERDIVEPDIIFIARDRLSIILEKMVDGAPDIVLEILSPSTRLKDLNLRAALYARSGVREYW
jgi:Uma2 family endonuclease